MRSYVDWKLVDTEKYGINYAELMKAEKIELLNWAMQVCSTGSTPSMIRRVLHNKLIEIAGEGEKA